MSSTTRLLVLGVVRLFQPVHGYDVRRELISWHAEEWANVAPGSIYNALKTLEREGAIEVAGTAKVGDRPERTSYQITPRGNAEMMELLRETLWKVQSLADPLVAALSMMWFLDREELIRALEARTLKIQGNLAHARMIAAVIDDVETPLHVRAMMQLMDARLEAEVGWAEQFRADLAAGQYRCKGDPGWAPPGLGHGPKARTMIPTGARDVRTTSGGTHDAGLPVDAGRRLEHAKRAGSSSATDKAAATATVVAHRTQKAAAKAATKIARARSDRRDPAKLAAANAVTKIARAKSELEDRNAARAQGTRAAIARANAAVRKKR